MMVVHQHQEEVPSFLHTSPFLPMADSEYDSRPTKRQPRPTLLQVLKAKPIRMIFGILSSAVLTLLLVNELNKAHVFDRLTGPSCYFSAPVEIPTYYVDQVDWSQYAYAQYATNRDYLCNSVMFFERLHALGSRAERILMFRANWIGDDREDGDEFGIVRELLRKAEREYEVNLVPVKVQHRKLASYSGPNWSDSYTKLLAFNQTQYSRILALDSDSTLLSPMDELFFLPPTPVALPRAYWLKKPTLASHLMLITPSRSSFTRIEGAIEKGRIGYYDMEIINSLFGGTCRVIPQRRYALLSGEFRSEQHSAYLGNKLEAWNPEEAMQEAKYVHFSDFPLGKPWVVREEEMEAAKPGCRGVDGSEDCRDNEAWLDLYRDFARRRKDICGL